MATDPSQSVKSLGRESHAFLHLNVPPPHPTYSLSHVSCTCSCQVFAPGCSLCLEHLPWLFSTWSHGDGLKDQISYGRLPDSCSQDLGPCALSSHRITTFPNHSLQDTRLFLLESWETRLLCRETWASGVRRYQMQTFTLPLQAV